MKNKIAVELATKVAKLLMTKSKQFGRKSVNEINGSSLMGTLSIMMAATARNVKALNPWFQEIILFGSTAEGREFPMDVDLMAFDGGFYSNVLLNTKGAQYGSAKTNLKGLLTGWFGLTEADAELEGLLDGNVDLLVLPVGIFTDPDTKKQIAEQQFDPEFFDNAFSCIWRFDQETGQFVKTDVGTLEQRCRSALMGTLAPVEATA